MSSPLENILRERGGRLRPERDPLPELTAAEIHACQRMKQELQRGTILEGVFRVNRDGGLTYQSRTHFTPV